MNSKIILAALFSFGILTSNAQKIYDLVYAEDYKTKVDSLNLNMCNPPDFGIAIPFSQVSKYDRITLEMHKKEIGSEKWEMMSGVWMVYRINENKSKDNQTLNCAVMDPEANAKLFHNYSMCDKDRYEWHLKHEHKVEAYSMIPSGETEEYYDKYSKSWKKRKLYVKDKFLGETKIFRFEMPHDKLMDLTRKERWSEYKKNNSLDNYFSSLYVKMGEYYYDIFNSIVAGLKEKDEFEKIKEVTLKIDSIKSRKALKLLKSIIKEAHENGADVFMKIMEFEYTE